MLITISMYLFDTRRGFSDTTRDAVASALRCVTWTHLNVRVACFAFVMYVHICLPIYMYRVGQKECPFKVLL